MLTRQIKNQIFWLAFFILFLCGCSGKPVSLENSLINKEERIDVEEVHDKEIERANITKEITISAVGDILIHERVYNDAKTERGYDFMPMLEQVKQYLGETTITFANQETMIGGVEEGLSTYPTFNSPTEVGDALKEIGVNVVSIANNHTLDRGETVIQSAIKHWETIDMMYVGAYRDVDDRKQLRIIETDEEISVSFLAYTYGTNGIPVPDGKDYLVNIIDRDMIEADIVEAKKKADVTIISLHFGNEYERMPNEEQKELVQFVADRGVHVVLGHHPHVLQPVDWVTGRDGNQTLVAYSLGNFLSGQDELYRQIGGILKFSITKVVSEDEATITVHSPTFLPTYNASENEKKYRVIPMHQVTDDVLPNADKHYKEIQDHLSQWMPELEIIKQ